MESYYRVQATFGAEQAASTTLLNVIDRCRRSEAAWLAMAADPHFTQIKCAVGA